MKHEVAQSIWEEFERFSPGPLDQVEVFFAPGRVNLIGEHTDYNGGYVLPAALNLGVYTFVRQREDGVLRFASTGFDRVVSVLPGKLMFRQEDDFANYPKGVIALLKQVRGVEFSGGDFLFHGNLPYGAGLSSSAAIELATAVAVTTLTGAQIHPAELAQISQHAENQFVGVNCGIMDQFAVAMGQKDKALSLNCKTLDYQLVPIQTSGYRLVITNTNKRRGLADSKYNERRTECEQALHDLQQVNPDLTCLADVNPKDWSTLEQSITNDVWHKRARHVVFENSRAKSAAQVLAQGEIRTFGEMMNESHQSLRDDYEVTGRELDALVEAACAVEGCIGSRMTGAGFGGCTVSLVELNRVPTFEEQVHHRYTAVTGLKPSFYVCEIGDGAHHIERASVLR